MITINRIAIHEIVKEAQYNEASTFITSACLTVNETTIALVEKLHDSYKSDNLVYAVFNFQPDSYFPTQFQTYNSAKNDNVFLNFTRLVTQNLRNKIVSVTLAKGGFVVYADYTNAGNNYVGVFFIRDAQGVVFNKNLSAHNVEINSVTYMNTEKLVMACRINIDKLASNDGKYLTFLRRGQAEISDYFFDWICSMQPESSKEFTEHLYEMVNGMDLPLNRDTGLPIDLNIHRQNVVNYVRERNRIVDLRDLGRYFYDDENKFIEFRDLHSIEIDNEFKADNSALRKFNLIELKARGISVKFSRALLTSGDISIGRGNQVVIKSEALQNALRLEQNS